MHHLLLIPDFSCVGGLYQAFKKHSSEIDQDGHCYLRLEAPEIVEISEKSNSLAGLCHVFTSWTALYKEFNSIRDCYKGIYSQKIQEIYRKLVQSFGSEIYVLLDAEFKELSAVAGEEIAKTIATYREGRIRIEEGGGRYGKILLSKEPEKTINPQRSLDYYL
ncbi:MAG: hypothetical protein ACE5HW_05790 [Candidatus Methanofastidiosia archaeon]